MTITEIRRLPNPELLVNAHELAKEGRRSLVELLKHLSVMDEKGTCEDAGYSNLYVYCTQALRLSEAEAYWRIHVAKAARIFPELYDLVEAGKLTLTAVVALTPHLTDGNKDRLFALAEGKGRRDIESIAASLHPQGERRDVAARYPARQATVEWRPPHGPRPPDAAAPESGQTGLPTGKSEPVGAFDKIEAVDGQRVRLHFDVGPETAKLLERAREVMRHKFPFASFEDIVREALKLLLDEKDPELRLKLQKENAQETLTGGRRIPNWVRRRVWARDHGRCAFVGEGGRRCEERSWLEYDHVVPYAKGGRSDDPANVRLLCRAHNQREAQRHFGGPPATPAPPVRGLLAHPPRPDPPLEPPPG